MLGIIKLDPLQFRLELTPLGPGSFYVTNTHLRHLQAAIWGSVHTFTECYSFVEALRSDTFDRAVLQYLF